MTPCLHCSSGPSQLLIKRKQHCLLLASLLLSALFCSFSTSLLLLCSLCCFSAMSSRNVHVLSRNQVSERLVLVEALRSGQAMEKNARGSSAPVSGLDIMKRRELAADLGVCLIMLVWRPCKSLLNKFSMKRAQTLDLAN